MTERHKEQILWKGRQCSGSFLPLILAGILTIWIYGIGFVILTYAILKWLRITYVISDKRVVKKVEHFAFYGKETMEIKYHEIQNIKISRPFLLKLFNCWKIEIACKDKKIILKTDNEKVVSHLKKKHCRK